LFRDTIPGLDRAFKTDIKAPKVVLITGPPGSLKSSFVYVLMTKYLEKTGEFGLYTTLEESAKSHLENMEALGMKMSLKLQISDFTDLRDEGEAIDYLKFTEKMIDHFKETRKEKFTVFAFDSLGALYSLMEHDDKMRKKMYHFFKKLRESNLISFIIMERSPDGESNLLGNEGFLSDGIILLGLKRKQGKLLRYLQVEKMRATQHSMEAHAIEVRDGQIAVLGPIFDQ
jgi:KaiC/GvpD/RAD55 family RecA-like ATPase